MHVAQPVQLGHLKMTASCIPPQEQDVAGSHQRHPNNPPGLNHKANTQKGLVAGWPDYIGIVDTSSHGVGGVVVGELSELPSTVFCLQWPAEILEDLVLFDNPGGKINNSDLEMAGLLLLWLCLKTIAPNLAHKHIALFSDILPTVSWVNKMASRKSRIAAQLVRALALCLNIKQTCPLTPVHIPGVKNALTDIPSRLFGSVKEWECKTDGELLTLFNEQFPLPKKASWTCFQFNTKVTTCVISVLQMKGITLAKWQQLPRIGRHTGQTG
jgi:hypothetical protein